MGVFCGIDRAERHHDVALVNESGRVIAQRRISESVQGYQQLLDMLAQAGDASEAMIPVAIETPRGLLVACLRASGRPVFAINPISASRYRERHAVSRKKSDSQDAIMLANVLRTDMALHRPLPADTHKVQALAVLARAQQDALLAVVDATCSAAATLKEAAVTAFRSHPDYQIITSFPGLGEVAGARLLAEIGDDRTRFTDARALKAYAGAAPVTRSSGRTHAVVHRRVKNRRLAAVGYVWAFAALTASPGARAHYDRRKQHGDRHAAALRNLYNRFLGCLFHCLTTRQTYQEHTAFPKQGQQRETA